MTKTGLEFRNWGPARRVGSPSEARTILVIVICLIFVICYLEFLITLVLQDSSQSLPAEPLKSDPRKAGSSTGPKHQVFDVE